MGNPPWIREAWLTILIFAIFLFIATNVNTALGTIYLFFIGGSFGLLLFSRGIFNRGDNITFQKQPGGTFKAIIYGMVGWLVLLVASVLILRYISPQQATFGSIIAILGATTPALATSKITNLVTFGLLIPFAETMLWARGLEFVSDLFKFDMSKNSLRKISKLWLWILILSLVFVFFHLTAKGITATASLLVVFMMMVISLVMVAWFGEIRQAVWMHIWANSVASYLILFGSGAI